MFLGFDIGNTNTSMGIYENSVVPATVFRFDTIKNTSPEKLGTVIQEFLANYESGGQVDGLAFSTVAPEVTAAYKRVARDIFNCDALEINHTSRLSISIAYHNPAELGPDRIVNAEAAFREHGASLVVDIGTAATFCVVLEDGTFDGGIIAPGIGTTIKALAENASRLPAVNFEMPDRLVAKDTVNAIKSGFFYGWISLVEGMVAKIRNQYAIDLPVIMTGGYSHVLFEHLVFDGSKFFDPDLTMKGIKYIYDLNR